MSGDAVTAADALGGKTPSGLERMTRSQRRLLALLGLPTLGLSLAITIVSAYLPVLIEDFTTSGTVIGLLIGAEGVFALFLPLMVGAWSDGVETRLGKRLPFLAVAGPIAAVALVLMPVAPSLPVIAVVLFVFYVGYFSYYPPYRSLFPDLVPETLYGRAQSSQAIWRAVGLGLALVSGGALLALWRPLPFLIAAAVLAGVTAVILILVREPRSPVGCCLPQGLRAMLTASWDIWRGKGEVRAFVVANALWEFALAALKTFVVLFVVIGLGRSVGFASVVIGLGAAGSLVAAAVSGSLGDRFGIAQVMHIALWVYGLGLLIPFFTQADAVVAAVPVIAFGGAVIMTLPYGLLMELMPEERHGAATGLYGFSRGLGIVLGPLVAGAAIDLLAPLLESTRGYAALWLVMGVATLASIVPLRRIGTGR